MTMTIEMMNVLGENLALKGGETKSNIKWNIFHDLLMMTSQCTDV